MIINLSDFNNVQSIMSDGFKPFVDGLLADAQNLSALLRQEGLQNNMDDIKVKSHKLKSLGRQCGLDALGELSARIEREAIFLLRGDEVFNPDSWQAAADELDRTLQETRQALAEINAQSH